MSQLIFKAKLLNVENNGVDDKGNPKMRLIFASQKFDKGLEEIVPCSQNVSVVPDHHHMKDFYLHLKVVKFIYLLNCLHK